MGAILGTSMSLKELRKAKQLLSIGAKMSGPSFAWSSILCKTSPFQYLKYQAS